MLYPYNYVIKKINVYYEAHIHVCIHVYNKKQKTFSIHAY